MGLEKLAFEQGQSRHCYVAKPVIAKYLVSVKQQQNAMQPM